MKTMKKMTNMTNMKDTNNMKYMKNLMFLLLSTFLCFVASNSSLHAQDDRAALDKLFRDDSDVVAVVAGYDADVRTSMFVAAGSAELIARVSDLQRSSNEAFKNAINGYPKEEQSRIWNLTRFDGLITQLRNSPSRDKASFERVIQAYPNEVRDDAVEVATNHFEVLASIDQVREDFDRKYASLMEPYPASTREAMHILVKNPDALSLLNDNMRMCVILGDVYRRNADMVQSRFHDLNLAQANRKAADMEQWKSQLAANPEAQSEMKQSANDFAKEQGYQSSEMADVNPTVINHYVAVPYGYWAGYPWWYETPCWVPYPCWYHVGFYYHSGAIVWWGTPSWYFLHWHFHHRPHFSMYPHITNFYLDYYCWGPPRYSARSVYYAHSWYYRHEDHMQSDFRENRNERINRIRTWNTSLGTQGTRQSTGGRDGASGRNSVNRPGTSGTNRNLYNTNRPATAPNVDRVPSQTVPRDNRGSVERPRSNPSSGGVDRSVPHTPQPRTSEPGRMPERTTPSRPSTPSTPRGGGTSQPRTSQPRSVPSSPSPSRPSSGSSPSRSGPVRSGIPH